MGSEVEQLFECIVCGKAWPSKQSLRAHMKVHRGEGYMRTSLIVRREEWEKFTAMCKKHKSTSCHLMSVLIKSALKGEELGVIDLGTPNPMIVQVQEIFLGKPRSGYKMPLTLGFMGKVPICRYAYGLWSQQELINCSKLGTNVPISRCEQCHLVQGMMEVR